MSWKYIYHYPRVWNSTRVLTNFTEKQGYQRNKTPIATNKYILML